MTARQLSPATVELGEVVHITYTRSMRTWVGKVTGIDPLLEWFDYTTADGSIGRATAHELVQATP